VRFAVVVPAWLHGLDWAGDPYASRPCAERQVQALGELAERAGLTVELAAVGDPDPTSAIDDARSLFRAAEILLCTRPRHLRHPLDLAHRVRRTTGLAVAVVPVGDGGRVGRARRATWLHRGGHCVPEVAASA